MFRSTEGVCIFMSMRLFLLGLPGSGKSTAARHVIGYVGKQQSDCYTAHVNDYAILYIMYKADKEGIFFRQGKECVGERCDRLREKVPSSGPKEKSDEPPSKLSQGDPTLVSAART